MEVDSYFPTAPTRRDSHPPVFRQIPLSAEHSRPRPIKVGPPALLRSTPGREYIKCHVCSQNALHQCQQHRAPQSHLQKHSEETVLLCLLSTLKLDKSRKDMAPESTKHPGSRWTSLGGDVSGCQTAEFLHMTAALASHHKLLHDCP